MVDNKYPPLERRDDRVFLSAWLGAGPTRVPADLKPGQPCGHPGCLHHVSHPCEGCGRTAGRWLDDRCEVTDLEGNHCPNQPTRYASIDGAVVHLCEQCYQSRRERLAQ